jgi:hypothetical protein
LAPGEEIARLVVDAEEGALTFPLRYGIETAFVEDDDAWLARLAVRPNMAWWAYPGPPEQDYRRAQRNYRATLEFGRSLHVKRLRWELRRRDLNLLIAAQGYRLAAPEPDRFWRRVFDDGPVPVHEFIGASRGASVARDFRIEGHEADWPHGEETAARIETLARRATRVEYEVENAERGLFVVRDAWAPGWQAALDGEPAQLLRVNRFFRGLVLPAGRHRIEMRYAPRVFYISLCLSLASLVALAVAFALTSSRPRPR